VSATFFTDRDLGQQFPDILKEAGLSVVRHSELLVVIGDASYRMLATNFVATRVKIENFIAVQQRPFIGKLYRPSPADLLLNPSAAGRVELWYPR